MSESLLGPFLLLVLTLSPIPSYGLLLSKQPAGQSTIHRIIEFAVYWLCYLTCISLIMGHTGIFSRGVLIVILLASFAPLLSRMTRRAALDGLRRSFFSVAGAVPKYKLLAALSLGFALLLLYLITTTTTSDYDSCAYHIPFAFEWLQQHHFTIHPQFAGTAIGYYPSNWEALCAVFALLFHSDIFLLLPNLMAWFLLVASIVGVGQHVNISPRSAWSAALILSATPIVFANILSLKVDLPLAAFLFTVLFFGLNATSSSTARYNVWGLMLALAMMLGIKTTGPIYAAFAFVLVLLLRPGAWRVVLAQLWTRLGIIVCVISLLLGGSWYIRNVICFGNPLGLSISAGQLFRTTLAGIMKWSSASDWQILHKAAIAELGLPFIIVSVLTLILLIIVPPRFRTLCYVVFALLATLVLFAITPYSGDNGSHNWQVTPWVGQAFRYGFPFLGFLAITFALSFDRSSALSHVLQFSAFILCASKLMAELSAWSTVMLILLVVVLIYTTAMAHWLSRYRMRAALTVGALMLIVSSVAFASLQRLRKEQRPEFVRAVHVVLKNRSITNLTYTESHQSFVWYGAALNNAVSYSAERDITRLIRFMEQRGSQALGMGPNTIPKRDSAGLYAELLRHRSFRRIYGDLYAGQPVIFMFKKK